MVLIQAESISSNIAGLLGKNPVRGSVHSLFEEVLNIRLEDNRLVTVTTHSKPSFPSAIRLEAETPYSLGQGGISIGEGVDITRGRILFDISPLCIEISRARSWNAGLQFIKPMVPPRVFHKNLNQARRIILEYGNSDGLSSILDTANPSRLVKFVMPGIERLAQALRLQNHRLVSQAASGILGFGPGLTPSADDFILGIMASLYYIGNYYGCSLAATKALVLSMTEGTGGRTTLISETMLGNGAQGYFPEPLRRLMQAITSRETVKDECVSVMDIGGCSGSDCASGVVFGGMLVAGVNRDKEVEQCR